MLKMKEEGGPAPSSEISHSDGNGLSSVLSDTVTTSHVWLPSTQKTVNVIEEPNSSF